MMHSVCRKDADLQGHGGVLRLRESCSANGNGSPDFDTCQCMAVTATPAVTTFVLREHHVHAFYHVCRYCKLEVMQG